MDCAGSFPLRLNLSLLIIHDSIVLVLLPFRLETVRIGSGKILVLLSLLLIFIQLEIVAGILFDEQSGLSSNESALTSLALLLTNLSGLLPKTSLTTSVNLPFLLLFVLMVLLLILQLKRPISSASYFPLTQPWMILAFLLLLLLLLLSGVLCLYPVSYTHLRAHETPEHLVCRLLLEKK